MSNLKRTRGDTWTISVRNLKHSLTNAEVDLTGAAVTCTVAGLSVSTTGGGVSIVAADGNPETVRIRCQFEPADTATISPGVTYPGDIEIILSSGERQTRHFRLKVLEDQTI